MNYAETGILEQSIRRNGRVFQCCCSLSYRINGIFELVTKYNNWEEIRKGNLAVAFATGGKIFGVANIFRYSIEQHNSLPEMIGWGFYGFTIA